MGIRVRIRDTRDYTDGRTRETPARGAGKLSPRWSHCRDVRGQVGPRSVWPGRCRICDRRLLRGPVSRVVPDASRRASQRTAVAGDRYDPAVAAPMAMGASAYGRSWAFWSRGGRHRRIPSCCRASVMHPKVGTRICDPRTPLLKRRQRVWAALRYRRTRSNVRCTCRTLNASGCALGESCCGAGSYRMVEPIAAGELRR
jgi:hypothetical protein